MGATGVMTVARVSMPSWTTAPIVAVGVALALGVMAVVLLAARRPPADAPRTAAAEPARGGVDAMLLVSALAIAGLAAVFLTRP